MISAARRKADIEKTIRLNPTKIKITGERRYIDDGRERVEKIQERELTVRIFPVSKSTATLISEHHGTAKSSNAYGMLADADAGFEDSSVVWEKFESAFGMMRIEDIFPQIVRGELCGFQITLERVT